MAGWPLTGDTSAALGPLTNRAILDLSAGCLAGLGVLLFHAVFPRSMRRQSAVVAVVLVTFVWMTALVVAPVAASQPGAIAPTTSAFIYAAGSIICHQRPERSFHYDGAQLPVCARCLGLYAGGLVGAVAWMVIAGLGRRPLARARAVTSSFVVRNTVLLAALPTVVSVATAFVGWWDPDNVLRAILAVPLGAAIGASVSAVAAGDLR